MSDFSPAISFIRSVFPGQEAIPLHEPRFRGNEKKYLEDAIDSTFVSSLGAYVDRFETVMASLSGTNKAVAVVNGTAALQVALRLAGVEPGNEVLTQALTFVATSNAILYSGAFPVFIDVDLDTMGLSPNSVDRFLAEFGEERDGICYNKKTGRKIAACLPMHTFGFPLRIAELIGVCDKWKIPVVEDAAEALGSEVDGRPLGSFGLLGTFSFNGNKIVTSGGGGAIVSRDPSLAARGKYLTTTAKVPHPYEYVHDELGYNFRMPNLNAALLCAQLEQLQGFLENKRLLADQYADFFAGQGVRFRKEMPGTRANYWLMCIELDDITDRNLFLQETNRQKIATRPIWQLLFRSPVFKDFQRDAQENAVFLEERIVNIPSSVR